MADEALEDKRLVNLRGRVEAGTMEALEGGTMSGRGVGWSAAGGCFSPARASLYRSFTGVALTIVEGRLGFFISVKMKVSK